MEHGAHVRFAESQHHVELVVGTDIPADVESAGQVVQGDGADAGHEDALEHAFEFLEYFTVESAGMGQGMINVFSLLVQNDVGKVIVFVDDEVKFHSGFSRMQVQVVQLADKVGLFFHLLCKSGKIIRLIHFAEQVHHHAAIVIEIFFQ